MVSKFSGAQTPIWLMRQAGRFLPEYRALREMAGSFWRLCQSPEFAAEATMQPIRRFGLDAAIIFSDILLVPAGLGCDVVFDEKGPHIPPVTAETLQTLVPNPVELRPVCEALGRVRGMLDDDIPLFGFCGGPWTLACFMTCGNARDRQENAKLWAFRDPLGFGRMIERLTDAVSGHLISQLEAGADRVQIFESLAGNLPPDLFEAYVVAPTKKIVARVRAKVPGASITGFPRQASLQGYLRYAQETGVDVLSLDTNVPADWAAETLPDITLQGNLDPLALVAGGEALERQTQAILAAFRGRRHIFNLGHGVLPQTPPEHVARLIELVGDAG